MVPPTRQQALIGCVAVLLLLAALGLHAQRHRDDARDTPASASQPASVEPAFEAGPLDREVVVVDVAGAVRAPGVYELRQGARVLDAVRRAGGLLPSAQARAVNRAAPLVDGQQIVVPERLASGAGGAAAVAGAAGTASPAGAGAAAGSTSPTPALVSINSADVAAFDALQGIGPVTAQKIVDDRIANGPFASVDELDRVPGIGPATIESLRAQVTL